MCACVLRFLHVGSSHLSIKTVLCLPIQFDAFSFVFFTALAKTSSKILNVSGENRHLCLTLHLRGKAFSVLPVSMMLAIGFLLMPSIRLRKFPSNCTFSEFLSCVLNSVKCFSVSIEMLCGFCPLVYYLVFYLFFFFPTLNQPCIHGI